MEIRKKPAKIRSRIGHWDDDKGNPTFAFVLDYDYDTTLYDEDVRELWCYTIEQAVYEFLEYRFSSNPKERSRYHAAKDFLFDDHYKFLFDCPVWPPEEKIKEINFRELCLLLGINPESFRLKLLMKAEEENKDKDYKSGAQMDLF